MTDADLYKLDPRLVDGGRARRMESASGIDEWRTFDGDNDPPHVTLHLHNGIVAHIHR